MGQMSIQVVWVVFPRGRSNHISGAVIACDFTSVMTLGYMIVRHVSPIGVEQEIVCNVLAFEETVRVHN